MVDMFDCARAQIYHNTGKLTPAQIKAKTGCTHIINGYLFNGKFQPVGWTVIDGKAGTATRRCGRTGEDLSSPASRSSRAGPSSTGA